jgi:hypothetical protein
MMKSDGNGGTVIKATPAIITMFAILVTIVVASLSFAFGYGANVERINNVVTVQKELSVCNAILRDDLVKQGNSLARIEEKIEWMQENWKR